MTRYQPVRATRIKSSDDTYKPCVDCGRPLGPSAIEKPDRIRCRECAQGRVPMVQLPDFTKGGTGPCADVDPEIFFPETSTPAARAEAVAICRTCPMMRACRDHGLTHESDGIWGGVRVYTTINASTKRKGMRLLRQGMSPRKVSHETGARYSVTAKWARDLAAESAA